MQKYFLAVKNFRDSDVHWIDQIFNICVDVLLDLSAMIGISYEAINILIFIVIQPLLIITFFILWMYRKKIND